MPRLKTLAEMARTPYTAEEREIVLKRYNPAFRKVVEDWVAEQGATVGTANQSPTSRKLRTDAH